MERKRCPLEKAFWVGMRDDMSSMYIYIACISRERCSPPTDEVCSNMISSERYYYQIILSRNPSQQQHQWARKVNIQINQTESYPLSIPFQDTALQIL